MNTESKIFITIGTALALLLFWVVLTAVAENRREEKLDSCISSEKVQWPGTPRKDPADVNDAVENCIKRYK